MERMRCFKMSSDTGRVKILRSIGVRVRQERESARDLCWRAKRHSHRGHDRASDESMSSDRQNTLLFGLDEAAHYELQRLFQSTWFVSNGPAPIPSKWVSQ